MGNERAAAEAERAISFFNPDLVLFVGVAGGLKKDVKLGDVVAATKIYGYEFGKANEEFHPRPEALEPSYALIQRARAVARRKIWKSRILPRTPDTDPAAIVAPMAAGSKVIASEASEAFKTLRGNYSDACAVEMEGYGFLRAVHANHQVQALVVRGISDLIEGKAESDSEGWQLQASRNAAAFTFEVLAKHHIGPERETTNETPTAVTDTAGIVGATPPLTRSFTGRTGEIDRIRADLGDFDSARPRITVVSGLSGMGKTQLSIHYAETFRDEYDLILWIPASDSLLATSAYAQLAADLALPGYNPTDPLRSSESAIRWVEKQRNWLVILDDANPHEASGLIPRRGDGHALITSVNPNWSAIADTKIALGGLVPDEAISFLTKRTGLLRSDAMLNVAEEFDFLPLALEQAAAYVEATGTDFVAYDQLLASHRAVLLGEDERSPFTDYPKSVYTAIGMNVSRVNEDSPNAMALLAFIAFLGHGGISRELIRDALEPQIIQSGEDFDEYVFSQMVAVCAKYSIISVKGDIISVHPLIQSFMMDHFTDEAREGWNRYALSYLSAIFPSEVENSSTWPICDQLIDHVVSAAKHAEYRSWSDEYIHALYANAGAYLHELRRDQQAYELLSAAYQDELLTYGEDDPRVALAMNNLIITLGDLERIDEAIDFGLKAVSILTKDDQTRLDYNIELGKLYSNISRIYLHKHDDYESAISYLKKAYEIHRDSLGEQHFTTAIDLNNIGTVYRKEGKWPQAYDYFQRAVSIHRSRLQDDDSRLAIAIYNLATSSYNLGFFVMTKRLLREAIAMNDSFSRRAVSPNQFDAVSGLAYVLRDHNQPGESLKWFDRAIDISSALYGADSPKTKQLVRERGLTVSMQRSPRNSLLRGPAVRVKWENTD